MFNAITSNMENASQSGSLYQGSVTQNFNEEQSSLQTNLKEPSPAFSEQKNSLLSDAIKTQQELLAESQNRDEVVFPQKGNL